MEGSTLEKAEFVANLLSTSVLSSGGKKDATKNAGFGNLHGDNLPNTEGADSGKVQRTGLAQDLQTCLRQCRCRHQRLTSELWAGESMLIVRSAATIVFA